MQLAFPLHVCIALTSCVTGAPNIICLPYHTPFPLSFSTCVVTSYLSLCLSPNSCVPLFLIWFSVKSNTLSPTCSEEVKCTLSLISALHVRYSALNEFIQSYISICALPCTLLGTLPSLWNGRIGDFQDRSLVSS